MPPSFLHPLLEGLGRIVQGISEGPFPAPSSVFTQRGSPTGVTDLLVSCQGHCDLKKTLSWKECPVLEDMRQSVVYGADPGADFKQSVWLETGSRCGHLPALTLLAGQ